MRALQRLVRNGNSTQVTIPKQLLVHLGWLPGGNVIAELAVDNESITLRAPRPEDFGARTRSAVLTHDTIGGGK